MIEVCPSCGDFVARLKEMSGWCETCHSNHYQRRAASTRSRLCTCRYKARRVRVSTGVVCACGGAKKHDAQQCRACYLARVQRVAA